MRLLLQIALSALLFTLVTHAWPWPPSLREFRDFSDSLIERRQADGDSKSSQSAAAKSAAATSARPAAKSSAAASSGAKETGTASRKDKPTGKSSPSSSSHHPKPTSINAQDPAGGIEMLTPSRTTSTYFKIGEDVTLVWNYTSLQITPSAVNVLASNAAGTWTLTANASVKETGMVVWKTKDDEGGANPLLTDTYTLVVYDANSSITDTPGPGELSPFLNFQFGMYLPQKYTPLGEFICATCSGAMSEMERTTLKFVFAMAGLTVLSFAWFAGDFLALF